MYGVIHTLITIFLWDFRIRFYKEIYKCVFHKEYCNMEEGVLSYLQMTNT